MIQSLPAVTSPDFECWHEKIQWLRQQRGTLSDQDFWIEWVVPQLPEKVIGMETLSPAEYHDYAVFLWLLDFAARFAEDVLCSRARLRAECPSCGNELDMAWTHPGPCPECGSHHAVISVRDARTDADMAWDDMLDLIDKVYA